MPKQEALPCELLNSSIDLFVNLTEFSSSGSQDWLRLRVAQSKESVEGQKVLAIPLSTAYGQIIFLLMLRIP